MPEADGVSTNIDSSTAAVPASEQPETACSGSRAILGVRACGRLWELERAADLEALWEAMVEFNDDERVPYWTEVWPAGVVLADWLYERREDIAGRPCLDLGCGIGLTTLAAGLAGARVLGMDYEFDALHFARRNAVRNGISGPGWAVMDWRRPAVRQGAFARIWGGDVMYEKRFAAPVLDFLEFALHPRGKVWLAEPCRSVYDSFRALLPSRGWACRCVRETLTDALYPQERPVPVKIWELAR